MSLGEQFYEQSLQIIRRFIPDNADENILTEAGKTMFKDRYRGTFAVNEIASMLNGGLKHGEMIIVNLDKRSSVGSHWIALVNHEKDIILYDSFGRQIPEVQNTEDDPEQSILEEDCGARCLSFLWVYERLGFIEALKI